ncbi:MAG: flagellin, partial [Epulopiscium sp.]|nr:flagellin [Candidatus Epulonipiscium sp.]
DTYTKSDREKIAEELNQLSQEITDITTKTEFNTKKLLNGSLASASVYLQVGANEGQKIEFTIGTMSAEALTVASANIGSIVANSTSTGAAISSLVETVNTAIEKVSSERAKLGAVQNRLEHTIKNLDVAAENLQASESRIRDTDMAQEMMNFTRTNILQQAATAMLAQANQAPRGVLQLLR